jgi:hypothetical protein
MLTDSKSVALFFLDPIHSNHFYPKLDLRTRNSPSSGTIVSKSSIFRISRRRSVGFPFTFVIDIVCIGRDRDGERELGLGTYHRLGPVVQSPVGSSRRCQLPLDRSSG